MGQKYATRIDPESGGVEIQLATMKSIAVLKRSLFRNVGPFLDRLDLGVQPFTDGIGDWMRDGRQNIGQVLLDQISGLPLWFQTAVSGPPKPAFPKRFRLLQG